MSIIDMRSDTVTKPTPSMRAAMCNAEVGDDVFGDDPTINQLQEEVAKLLGKEAGLFVPSGTQGNLICALTHVTGRGGEMIVGDESHMHYYEQGNAAQFGGIHSRVIPTSSDGTLPLELVEAAICHPGEDAHRCETQLICIENTQNRLGGRVLSVEYMDALGSLAKRHGIPLHVDGARLLNAFVELRARRGAGDKNGEELTAARLVEAADSVSLCLSKGLAAPVGSVIVGSHSFIQRARRVRKALGGGMRQAGILAAAGRVALHEMVDRLLDDHENARKLVKELAAIPDLGLILPPVSEVETNIVYIKLHASLLQHITPAAFVEQCKDRGLLTVATGKDSFRCVTHYMITSADIDRAVDIIKAITIEAKKEQGHGQQ